jgi:hypothetical protein
LHGDLFDAPHRRAELRLAGSVSTFFDATLIASVPLVTVIYRKLVLKKTGVAEFFLDTHRHCIVAALAI